MCAHTEGSFSLSMSLSSLTCQIYITAAAMFRGSEETPKGAPVMRPQLRLLAEIYTNNVLTKQTLRSPFDKHAIGQRRASAQPVHKQTLLILKDASEDPLSAARGSSSCGPSPP